MKTTFLIAAIVFVGLVAGMARGASTLPARQQRSDVEDSLSDNRGISHDVSALHDGHHAVAIAANHPKLIPNNNRQHLTAGRQSAPSPAGLQKPISLVVQRPASMAPTGDELPVRPPANVEPGLRLLNVTPHRSPNPAVINGEANSIAGKVGAISGTSMKHKP